MLVRLLPFGMLLMPLVAAAADSEPGVTQVSIVVGESHAIDVGGAMGLVCDDSSVVEAKIGSGKKGNEVTLTGLKEGVTLCRAGSDALGMKRMMRVRVSKGAASPDDTPTPGKR